MGQTRKNTNSTQKNHENPGCGECHHSQSFHPREGKKRNRKCKAFGCTCKNYIPRTQTVKK